MVTQKRRSSKRKLTVRQVRAWAGAHFRREGRWPVDVSGAIGESPDVTWGAIANALRNGGRGLPGGTTLPRFLDQHFPAERAGPRFQQISYKEIRLWAQSHHRRTGRWPTVRSGLIPGTRGVTWRGVDKALMFGRRGLPGGSSLALFLDKRPGSSRRQIRSTLTIRQILAWARAHVNRIGRWPSIYSGEVAGIPDENWCAINMALKTGHRGLPGGTTLARLLGKTTGSNRNLRRPRLTYRQVLAWADAQHRRTGQWPNVHSGPVVGSAGETWTGIDVALKNGKRGLGGGATLARFLAERRAADYKWKNPKQLSIQEILAWADAHHRRTGRWPTSSCGAIPESPGDTWFRIRDCLYDGSRGLPGGSSLVRFLEEHRGVRNVFNQPPLSERQILAWALEYHRRHGRRPTQSSGPIRGAPGEDWRHIIAHLSSGGRGLPGGTTFRQLIIERTQYRRSGRRPQPVLAKKTIVLWARAHYRRTGRWPNKHDGHILDAPGETWLKVDGALRKGTRGLSGGDSLARFLKHCNRPKPISDFL